MSHIPTDTTDWRIDLTTEARMWLHFHMEASDGAGYLERHPEGSLVATLEIAPGREADMAAWLAACAADLGVHAASGEGAPPAGEHS
jgi:hypothetical protein